MPSPATDVPRLSRVFHRNPSTDLPIAVGGEGCYLIDRDGKRYLDGSGGAAVSCLGHNHPAVIRAAAAQVERLAFAHTAFFTNEPMEQLADHLVAAAPDGIARVYFVSGGSEAIEAGLKLARQYFVETGQPTRTRFVARRQSYHGNTLGALAVGGNRWRRQAFEPLLIPADHIMPCYPYREQAADESAEAFGRRAADDLDRAIQAAGPDTVAAFVAEPVVGATMGAVPAVPGYFARIREICDRYGVLLILDEVMCGMGRTGTLFACDADGVRPDLIAIAKGLGGGIQPIGALLVSDQIFTAIRDGSGFFQHGHTYMGHPVACAAALAVQTVIAENDLLATVTARGAELAAALAERLGDHPHVGDLRGRGLFRGLELVQDRATKAPFPAALKVHARVKRAAMDDGLICYPMGGTIDGQRGDHVLLAPPFILSSGQVGELVDKLGRAVDRAVRGLRPPTPPDQG